jgi:hypothetical protein
MLKEQARISFDIAFLTRLQGSCVCITRERRAGSREKEHSMPASTTKHLAINAAFLKEIKEDHCELQEVLARLSGQLSNLSPATPVMQLLELLQQLRDRLAMHFALEEGYGYCEDAIAIAPRLSGRAEVLRAEHEPLFVQVQQLVEGVEKIVYHETASRHLSEVPYLFQRFLNRFEQHEREEGALILEAYEQDLGSGD